MPKEINPYEVREKFANFIESCDELDTSFKNYKWDMIDFILKYHEMIKCFVVEDNFWMAICRDKIKT